MIFHRLSFIPCLVVLAGFAVAQSGPLKWKQLRMEVPKATQLATPIGPKSDVDTLHLSIGIPGQDEAGLQSYVNAVSDPKNLNYRHFMSPEQVGQRFGISQENVQKVVDYLKSQGMNVRLVAKNRLSILADATVAQAETAFRTSISEFTIFDTQNKKNATRYSFTVPPSVPPSIKRFVRVIGGLENFMRPKAQGPLTPDQLRGLYSVAPIYRAGNQGLGRTIGISNWDGYRLSNVPLEYTQFNLPVPTGGVGSNVSVVSIDGQNGNTDTYQGEGDIDIQCALGVAPLCNLVIYDNANQSDLLGVLTQEANDNTADIITESYGWPTAGNQDYFQQVHAIHLSMNAQGITYMCASGDTGVGGIQTYQYPDIDPEVLVVGGTSVSVDNSGNRLSEVVWNNSIGQGGGGWAPTPDAFNVLPLYQKGNGVPTNIPYRLVPDISMDADPATGYEIFMGDLLSVGWGGTSCASPTAAGALADCQVQLIAAGELKKDANGHYRMGRIQDLLYSFNGDPTIFFDVVSGSNGTLPNGADSAATVGWDTASGWGAPNFNGLVDKLLSLAVPSSLVLAPTQVIGGTTSTGTVTLNLAAPTGGTVVTLASDSFSATVPPTVTVAAGQTTATFTINTVGATVSTTANISATSSGVSANATLTVLPTALVSVTITPSTVVGGNAATGTVTLNGPAPAGGIGISLTSNNPNVIVPQNVEVAAGSISDTFTIATSAVTSSSLVTVTGSDGTNSAVGTFTVGPASFSGFSVTPSTVVGGNSVSGTVSLNGTAPSGGITVNLTSSNGAITVPATAIVPSGASSVTIPFTTHSVSTSTQVTLTASQGSTSFTAQVTVTLANLSTVSITPNSIIGGSSATGTVTLNGPAPAAGLAVTLVSSSTSVTIPASVQIPGLATSATFTATTIAVSSLSTVTITATQGSVTQTATLTVNPATLSGITLTPATIGGGSISNGTISLNGPAGPGGTTVSLASSSQAATVPATVTIEAGQSSGTFTVSTVPVANSTSVTITGTQGSTSATATLSINPTALQSLTISPNAVIGGASATGTLTLNGAAPAGGMTINLSSNSAVVNVPNTVTISGGSVSTTFAIGTNSVGQDVNATITATLGMTTLSSTLTVQSPLLLSVSLNPETVIGGNASTGMVTLTRPSPAGGTTITLASSNSVAVLPASVMIASGATSASFSIGTSGVASTTSVSITASQLGTSKVSVLTIQPASLASISVSPTDVFGGSIASGTVQLNGQAPPQGLVITLGSSNSAITLPSTVKISTGNSTATFTVGTKAVKSLITATISAKAGGVTETATLTVHPAGLFGISLSTNLATGGSNVGITGTITLSGNAPPSGAIVTLLSSNPKAASVPASILVRNGTSSTTFAVNHFAVSSPQSVTLSATLGGVTKSATLTLNPFQVVLFTISPTSVAGGDKATGTLTLNAIPSRIAGLVKVNVASSSTSMSVPSMVPVLPGSATTKFAIGTKGVGADISVIGKAMLNGSNASAVLTIKAPLLISVAVSPSTVKGKSTTIVTGTVTLSKPAPNGGMVINLQSSAPSAASCPNTVTIASGRTSGTFKVSHSAVTTQTSVTISASLAAITKSASLLVNP